MTLLPRLFRSQPKTYSTCGLRSLSLFQPVCTHIPAITSSSHIRPQLNIPAAYAVFGRPQRNSTFMGHSSPSSAAATFQFAEGEEPDRLIGEVDSLLNLGWNLDDERMGLKKTFYFKSYFKVLSYVNLIAAESASKKHHPTLTVRIGSVDVHWTTHKPRGLSQKDILLARYCDYGAQLIGVVEEGHGKKCGLSN